MTYLKWEDCKEFLRIAIICLLWYAVSSANGVMGKWILSEFAHPMTVTMVQLLSITVLVRPILAALRVRPLSNCSWAYYAKFVVPLALAKFASSALNHVSIWKVPVSYAHTVKASMPFFTVIITRVFLGQRYSYATYATLFPIVAGVAIATLTEVSFDVIGLSAALASTAGFSAMTIVTKKIRDDTGTHTIRLLQVTGQLSCIMFFPIWFFVDFQQVIRHPLITAENASFSILFWLAADGICYTMQNLLAFSLMNVVTPLTYSVANVSKRIFVITVSILMLGNHVTMVNVLGMMTSILGVGLYNKVKLDEKHARETLPTQIRQHKKLSLWNGANNNYQPNGKVQLTTPTASSQPQFSYTNGHGPQNHQHYSPYGNGSIPTSPVNGNTIYVNSAFTT